MNKNLKKVLTFSLAFLLCFPSPIFIHSPRRLLMLPLSSDLHLFCLCSYWLWVLFLKKIKALRTTPKDEHTHILPPPPVFSCTCICTNILSSTLLLWIHYPCFIYNNKTNPCIWTLKLISPWYSKAMKLLVFHRQFSCLYQITPTLTIQMCYYFSHLRKKAK